MHCIAINLDTKAPELQPFRLLREHLLPALETHRLELEVMYAPNFGRPETDPVQLMAVTVLQLMQRLPDRACANACRFDARWRYALGPDIPCFHPTTLTHFRTRLTQHDKAQLVLKTNHQAMREAGYGK